MRRALAILSICSIIAGTWSWTHSRKQEVTLPPAPQLAIARELLQQALLGDEAAIERILQQLLPDSTPPPYRTSPQLAPQRPLLAQSAAAAALALALTTAGEQPGQLAAIPQLMRQRGTAEPASRLDTSALRSSDRLSNEQLYQLSPLCIVSSFSHTATLERYRRLGLPLLRLPEPTQIGAIEQSIEQVALVSGQPNKGSKLRFLCHALLQSLGEQLRKLPPDSPLLIVELYRHFNYPSDKSLYLRWLHEQLPQLELPTSSSWAGPLNYEKLHRLAPKTLLVICHQPQHTARQLQGDPRWERLIQSSGCRYALIPSSCLHSPSQLLVLGIYDLVCALQSLSKESHRLCACSGSSDH